MAQVYDNIKESVANYDLAKISGWPNPHSLSGPFIRVYDFQPQYLVDIRDSRVHKPDKIDICVPQTQAARRNGLLAKSMARVGLGRS